MSRRTFIAAAALMATTAIANAQEACSTYTVQPGDSLSGIARKAYGSISFQRIWDANRNVIGANPNAITIGMRLDMPCEDGSLPTGGATDVVKLNTQRAPKVAEAVAKLDGIRIVTGSDYAPFTDEGMDGGGVVTQLIQASLDASSSDVKTSITFINDWGSHMDVLLPSGAFDATFPWTLPNCEDPNNTPVMKTRCDNYLFADPVYEIVTGMFTRKGDPLGKADHNEYRGKTVCIPDGYGEDVLPQHGLTDKDVTYVRPTDPAKCFEDLNAWKVDAVEMEVSQGADITDKLGLTDKVEVNEQLNSVSVLTAYVHKNNPDAEEILTVLNDGIAAIRQNGTWFNTVHTGFQNYYKKK